MGKRVVKLKKGEDLFNEGDPSDAMYIINKGRLAITKNKGNSSITLAELKAGDMLGEMAFFENAPRSAGAKAVTPETEVIELPFAALKKQYETMPIWVKAIMKAINGHLHRANTKIRQLEKTKEEEKEVFTNHTITQLMSILGFVAARYGEDTENGLQVPGGLLRTYTIQVFQLPTYKMQTLVETLCDFGYMEIENLGEGKQRMLMKDIDFVFRLVEFYNNQMFSDAAKKSAVSEIKLKSLKVLSYYGQREQANGKGNVTVNVTELSNVSMKEMGSRLSIADVKDMSDGILGDHTNDGSADFVEFNVEYVQEIASYWDFIYTLKAITSD